MRYTNPRLLNLLYFTYIYNYLHTEKNLTEISMLLAVRFSSVFFGRRADLRLLGRLLRAV